MAELDAVAAAKYFKDAKILVQMPKLDKDGNPVRNPETKRIVTVDEDLEPRHIVGVRDLGSAVSITVADGRKYATAKSGAGK